MIKRLITALLFLLSALAAFSQPAAEDPSTCLPHAHTLYVHSKTDFLIADTMDRALIEQKNWNRLGLVIVGEPARADLILEVDRQIFTHIHTFVLSCRQSTTVLGAGRQRAFDGTLAAGGIARQVVTLIASAKGIGP